MSRLSSANAAGGHEEPVTFKQAPRENIVVQKGEELRLECGGADPLVQSRTTADMSAASQQFRAMLEAR